MWPILGALAAVVIGMLAARPYEQDAATQMQNVRAANTASDWKMVDNAATAYIQANYAAVEANSSPTAPALITVPMLQSTNELPASFSSTNPWGQSWVVAVTQPTAGTLQASVISTGGNQIPAKVAPMIADLIGQEGGIVPYNGQNGNLNSSTAVGAYGDWSLPVADTGYANPGPGHLMSLLVFNNGNIVSDALYRVAVPGQPQLNEMQTALNMGGQNITNGDNVAAQSMQLAAGQPNGRPGSMQIGNSYYYGDTTNAAVRTPGAFYVQNQSGTAEVPLYAGPITSTGSVVAGNGYVTAYDTAGEGGTIALTGANGENFFLESLDGTLRGINSPWNEQLFSIDQGGNLRTASTVAPGAVATQGAGCGPNGEMAASTSGTGQILDCVSGSWQPLGGTGIVDVNTTGTESCTAGTTGILDLNEPYSGAFVPMLNYYFEYNYPGGINMSAGNYLGQYGMPDIYVTAPMLPLSCIGGSWMPDYQYQPGNPGSSQG